MHKHVLEFAFAIASLQLLILSTKAEDSKRKDLDLANHEPIAAAIGKFDEMTLYEGLPREQATSITELRAKRTVKLHDYPFYAEVLPIADDDAKAATGLLAEPKSLGEHQEPTLCGGFHPDYALKWKVGKDLWLALVCLTCHEVKFFGPKQLRLHCELKKEAFDELKKVLVNYQKSRPQTRVDEAKKE